MGLMLFFGHSKDVVIMKWFKALQDRCNTTTITIVVLGNSSLCPSAALTSMISEYPATPNTPLFQMPFRLFDNFCGSVT